MQNCLVVVVGPTAIGKTSTAIALTQHYNTAILSADSRQIYKELHIGTAVPDARQLQQAKHYFIQTKSIFDYYNASIFEEEANHLLAELFTQQNLVVMAGGSGLYVDAVCRGIDDLPTVDFDLRQRLMEQFQTEGIEALRHQLKLLDPDYYAQVDLRNYKRILKALEISLMTGKPYSSLLTRKNKLRNYQIIRLGLNRDRNELHQAINQRVDQMMSQGLLDEARSVYPHKHLNSLNTVGYRELFDYFDGKSTLEEAIELIKRNTRRYARKQISYFGRDEGMPWFHPENTSDILKYISGCILK
jgi:tRNA dimethylallyltransferase